MPFYRRFAALAFREATIPVDKVRELLQRHTVVALGALGFAYAGLRPDAGPRALGPGIDGVTSATFITEEQKRAILCGNAARFFRLTTRPRR